MANQRHTALSDIPLKKRLPQLMRSTVGGEGAQLCTLKQHSLEGRLLSNRLFVTGNLFLMLEPKEEALPLHISTAAELP